MSERIPVLYLAPWVDYGGSDTNTLDWFRWLDRSRFEPSLITTQPSSNRRLAELVPFAGEVWPLPELMSGNEFPRFIVEFIRSRRIELLHVMNSRIAYDLLSRFRALDDPPKVVVQLHVEEPTRDGYVRYVTTRYGGLVDAYSVSSAAVADAVVDYGIARERVEVIHTGIDAELYSRERVTPVELDEDRVHLLFVARLVEQKDPLLMVEVARELRRRGQRFCIHVIGGGELERDVRELVDRYELAEEVVFEPATHELRPWYAAADVLLMTSRFEGVPVIVYEALAMELPIVAPALDGIIELMGAGGGVIVEQRDRAEAYADALEPLLQSGEQRRRVGREGRELVRESFSVQEMGARHGRLYDRLLGERAKRPPNPSELPFAKPGLAARPARGAPRVSVVTPCFNHGRPLRECVESIRAQTYPDVELIVIDDFSTEAETHAYLRELDAVEDVEVLRMSRNRGPSAARNAGIARASGRYVLPVDADNLLLPDAIERLVSQLQSAGEHVGFIYQNCQYFGNREDYFEPPTFNPYLLARENYIDTCALIDRSIFDLGFSYAEDIVFGHEDWDFFLALAEHGVHGEPARGKTMLYRKEGFTRSDLVEWTGSPFHLEAAARHRRLFPRESSGESRAAPSTSLKARWAPAVSVISIAPPEASGVAWEATVARIGEQRFADFELLAVLDRELTYERLGPPIRLLPGRLAERPAELLAHALELARGRNVIITGRALPDLFGDPGSIERVVRLIERRSRRTAYCFVDVEERHAYPFMVTLGDERDRDPHSIAFARADLLGEALPPELDTGDPIGALARWIQIQRTHLEWRHLRSSWAERAAASGEFHRVRTAPTVWRAEREERTRRLAQPPALPGAVLDSDAHGGGPSWYPAFTAPLVRSQRFGFEEWAVTATAAAPAGFNPEYYLGVVHLRSLQGTHRVVRDGERGWSTVAPGLEPTGEEMEASLGYVDQVAFTMLEPLLVCRHARTGAPLMICGEDDPLHGAVEWPPLAVLGYIDRLPVNPRKVPTSPPSRAWLRGVVRTVDPHERRHRVGLGEVPAGQAPWELGALLDRDPGDGIAASLDSAGRLHTGAYAPTRHPFDVARTLRWVGAPATWRGFGRPRARMRAIARRGAEAVRHVTARPGIAAAGAPARPDAWLLRDPGVDRHPLYSAVHPVTADQLVTRDPSEPRELGYGPVRLLGYALTLAPVTGMLRRPHVSIPWGSRFGEALTRSEDPSRDAK